MATQQEPKEYLRALRKQLGMTQEKAADFLGISLRSYKRFEIGEAPVNDLVINQFEAKLKLINFNTTCPHCNFHFSRS